MLENLVQAYRKDFYDWSLKDWWTVLKKNKKISGAIVVLFLMICVFCLGITVSKSMVWIGTIGIIVVCVYVDRIMVRESRWYIANKQDHLEDVKRFLESIIKGENLFSERSVELLIERLSNKVESKNPFYNTWGKMVAFIKSYIVPMATFLAGIYSQKLSEMDLMTLLGASLVLLMVCGVLGIFWIVIVTFIKNILFRDIDAAVALREDLLDLQLIYFNGDGRKIDI